MVAVLGSSSHLTGCGHDSHVEATLSKIELVCISHGSPIVRPSEYECRVPATHQELELPHVDVVCEEVVSSDFNVPIVG